MDYKNRLKNSVVGIAGAGGIGSNCAMALARAGVGKIVVADFDTVSLSNLNRQYFFASQVGITKVDALKENIAAVGFDTEVEVHNVRLTTANMSTIFQQCEVLVEAFDDADQKVMLIEYFIEHHPQLPIVSGSGMGGWGNNNAITTVQSGNLYICGDQQTAISEAYPALSPRVGVVAHLQANQVVALLLNNKL